MKNETLYGTAGGTLLSILPVIHSQDVIKTMVLAAIGAIISFSVSMVLKCIIRKRQK